MNTIPPYRRFATITKVIRLKLAGAPPVDVGEWHAQDVSGKPELVSHELQNVVFEWAMPTTIEGLQRELGATGLLNLDWAEEHFGERVSGKPLNPPPSHERWPWASHNEKHQAGEQQAFSHSYPERFWPRFAPDGEPRLYEKAAGTVTGGTHGPASMTGIRFRYGDLDDLLYILERSPFTRQAVLPVWFPEDLAAARDQERVPCTLFYHFLLRGDQPRLDITYNIRSCDFYRYLVDDAYMACRLCQWVADQLAARAPDPSPWHSALPGKIIMHIGSLHVFAGDLPRLRREAGVR